MMFTEMERFLDSFLAMGVPGYDCMICHAGETVFRRFKGYADREQQLTMTGKERFNLYSCSKPVTVTAALQLWEQGSFKLEDALYEYLPEFRRMNVRMPDGIVPAQNIIRIWNLFTMTAGLTYDTFSPSLRQCYDATHGACPTRETMKYLAQEPLDFEPGTKWQYSLCHDVLAALVEVVSGMTFQDYVKKHIFDVLGMTHSTFLLPMTETGTIAPQYARSVFDPEKVIRVSSENLNFNIAAHPYRIGAEYASGGAGMVSTVEDYMLFANALCMGETLLKRNTIARMTTPQLPSELAATFWDHQLYGYGLGVRCHAPGCEREDFGWGGAAGAWLAVDPERRLTVSYAQHVLNSPNSVHRKDLSIMAQKLFAKETEC